MKEIQKYISKWITDYAEKNKKTSLIIGISGGIDSAVTSALCAETNINTIVISMPINQSPEQLKRARDHINWLKKKYHNTE